MDDFSEYYEAVEPGRRERAYAWATAIGLQAVDGLTTSRHLSETARRHFHKNSWYFRNALVRANYENVRLGVEKTQLPLEEFFKVLLFGENLELKNRYLRIGAEYGTAVVTATSDLHRHDEQSDVGVNVGVNVGVKLTATEELAVKALLRDSRLSSLRLAETLQISKRQAERVVASLKRKVGLRRRGAAKNGEWYFEGLSEERNVR